MARLSQSDLDDWVETTDGEFTIQYAMQELELDKADLRKLRVYLGRLAKRGILEHVGRSIGRYRLVQAEWADIDVFGESKWYNFDWPFPIKKYVRVGRKGVIVVAGEYGFAKTALLLNFAMLNAARYNVWYYDSESGPDLLKERLLAYDPTLTSLPFRMKFLDGYPEDAVKAHPNDVNIFDYIEIPDEPFKMAGILKRISDNNRDGVAVVAIQKPRGRDTGVGGQPTLGKPQLYLAVGVNGNGRKALKIVKAKSRVVPTIDPVNKQWTFSLDNAGMKFNNIEPNEWVDESPPPDTDNGEPQPIWF